MKFHFLGTTGYHPNNVRHTACMMLPELGVLFDAGTGIFRARDLIQTSTLDIFLSHVHLDHIVGLTFMYDVLYGKELSRVTVHVDESKIDAIETHLFHQQLFPVGPNFEIQPLPNEPLTLSDGSRLSSIPLEHPGGCKGFRIDWPQRSFAYITDTTADVNAEYTDAIKDLDTLVHECYFPDGHEEMAQLTGHSCLTPVAEVAAKVKPKRVFLVHVNPLIESEQPFDLDTVADIYPNLAVATDQQVIDV